MNYSYFVFLIFVLMTTGPLARADQELYTPAVSGVKSVSLGGPFIDELALKDADISQAIEVIQFEINTNSSSNGNHVNDQVG